MPRRPRGDWGWLLVWTYDADGKVKPIAHKWTDGQFIDGWVAGTVDRIESNGGMVGSRKIFNVLNSEDAWGIIEETYPGSCSGWQRLA